MKPTSAMCFPMDGSCAPGSAVIKGNCRFTLLTARILRLEYDPEGIFEDRPSQTVLYRNLPVPEYSVKDNGSRLEIDTALYHLSYEYGSGERLTPETLKIDAKNG